MRTSHRSSAGFLADVRMGMHMRVRTSARLRMRIPAQIHTYEGARPRALPEGLGFPVEKIEDMSAGEAEEHIAALYGDELYGLELDGEVSGEGAMRCACSPVHDEVRGICDMLGAGLHPRRPDRDRARRDALGGRGDAAPLRRVLRDPGACAAPADGAARRRFPFGKRGLAQTAPLLGRVSILWEYAHGPEAPRQRNGVSRWTGESSRSC